MKYKQEYDFIFNGLMLFGEIENLTYNDLKHCSDMIEKSQDFYIKSSQELKQYSEEEIKEAVKVNNASYKRTNRLQQKALELIKTNSAIFLSLTFNDDVFKNMNKETRRKNITRFLKKTCNKYIANIDFGKKNEREHYHALVVPKNDIIDCKEYHEIFYKSNIDFERVVVSNKKDEDIESTSKKISKYVNKLTNHAIKETTQQNRIIYSRN